MANIIDYLHWRGDLDFKQAPFNEVDNLILSEFVYVELKGLVPDPGINGYVTLKDASEKYFRKYDEAQLRQNFSLYWMAPFVMKEMAKSRRFASIRLSGYVNVVDEKKQSQFCAMLIEPGDGTTYVAFRGTDNSLIGWKENFNMSFLNKTPGQRKAVYYVNHMIPFFARKIRLGGHSKGGNLAIYAAVHAKPCIQNKIIEVYSNDGPGFTSAMMNKEIYQNMVPRIHTLIPQSSIIGRLLEHKEPYEVIESTQVGLMQHDAMSWQVEGAKFIHMKQATKESNMINHTINRWLAEVGPEQRKEFVDALFTIMDKAGMKTTADLARMSPKGFMELVKAGSNMPKESQEMLAKTLNLLWKEGRKTLAHESQNQGKKKRRKKVRRK